MTGSEKLLCTTTLRRWLELDASERSVVGDALFEVVPDELLLASLVGHEIAPPLPFFIHQPTQLGFFLVFGDRYTLGTTEAELRAVEATWDERGDDADPDSALEQREQRERNLAALRKLAPPHDVEVAPYFLAETTLGGLWHERFALHGLRKPGDFNATARAQLEAQGWRLPSEVELDFAGRLVHLTGHPGFLEVELGTGWCADAWHDDFTAMPADSEPWGEGAAVERGLYYGRVRFDAEARRATLRPAFRLLAHDVAWSPEARAARAERQPWRLRDPERP